MDIEITYHGSVSIITGITAEGRGWISSNVDTESAQHWGRGVVVEDRYLGDIVAGAMSDGLTVEGI